MFDITKKLSIVSLLSINVAAYGSLPNEHGIGAAATNNNRSAELEKASVDANDNRVDGIVDHKAHRSDPAKVDYPDNNGSNVSSCDTVRNKMAQIGASSKIEDIYRIDKILPNCLKAADSEKVTALLEHYQSMYGRFLTGGIDTDSEAFNEVMYQLYMNETPSRAQLDALPTRVQYLISLIQNNDAIYLEDLGEGYFTISHDLKQMAARFTPYLPVDASVFITRMAKDNQESFWNDASITIPFDELIQRALFWERYIQTYPASQYVNDAKLLYTQYRYFLFFGAYNTEWTDDAMHTFMDSQHNWDMIDLSNQPNSQLANDAKKYLAFLATPDIVRQQKYPVDPIDDDGYERHTITIAIMQLDQALQIPSPWNVRHYRDCSTGVLCEDRFDLSKLNVSDKFANICSSYDIGSMILNENIKGWGYDVKPSNVNNRQCHAIDLIDYKDARCMLDVYDNNTASISIFVAPNSDAINVYETKTQCEASL